MVHTCHRNVFCVFLCFILLPSCYANHHLCDMSWFILLEDILTYSFKAMKDSAYGCNYEGSDLTFLLWSAYVSYFFKDV